MDSSNERKRALLGESAGTARAKLLKELLFKLVVDTKQHKCFQCGKKIATSKDLSIEHKVSWQLSAKPVEFFYDLDNIAFSHLRCNIGAASRNHISKLALSNKQKTHCPQGHEYAIHGYTHSKYSRRSCKLCRRDGMRKARTKGP